MVSRRLAWACVWSLLPGFACSCAQALAQAAPQPTAALSAQANEDALHTMTQLAGVIFTGEVVAVRRHDGTNGSTGVVEIDFAVDDAIRGVSGGAYTLREWAGLWAAGDPPFRMGQRYLMLLHAPGPTGLSSPVGGTDGAIPIRGGTVVDLRWIATRAGQPATYPVARPTALPANARIDNRDGTATSSTPALSAVLSLLRSWEKNDAAAR